MYTLGVRVWVCVCVCVCVCTHNGCMHDTIYINEGGGGYVQPIVATDDVDGVVDRDGSAVPPLLVHVRELRTQASLDRPGRPRKREPEVAGPMWAYI